MVFRTFCYSLLRLVPSGRTSNPHPLVSRVRAASRHAFPRPSQEIAMAIMNGTNGTDTLNGTPGDDFIFGQGGSDVIAGLGGADFIDGGAGADTATYAASLAGVNVSLATGQGSGGDAEGDTLANIENLTGSAFDDTLEGSKIGRAHV